VSEHAIPHRGGRRRSRSRDERSPVSISPPGPAPIVALGVRTKLFLASLAIIGVSILVAHAYLANTLEHLLTNRIESDLAVRAELVRRDVERSQCNDFATCDALADDLGASARTRVTIIADDGRVLGDSEVPLERLPAVENHAQRPELVAARTSGHGVASRLSDTVHERMLYFAIPLGGGRGFARVAVPLVEVDQAKAGLNRALLVGSLLALAVAAVFSFAGAQLGSKSIRHLTDVARAMAKGDFSARAKLSGRDEFSKLGRALDQLAESLSITVRELSTERDLVGRILSGMQEGVLLLDDTGRIALVNPALREMLLLGEGAVGHMPIDVLQNAELAALLEAQSDGMRTGEIELSGLKPRRVLVRAVPLADEPGGVLAVFVDVTDIRRLESMRKDFVANASHELRTPITAVRSAAETLRLAFESDPEAAKHFIDIIERNAERLQRLVEDLLDLSRIEARELRLSVEPVELAEFVPRVLELLRERAAKKRITLSANVDPGVPPAKLDRRATEQILTNLVENAIKYSPDGARVVVSAKVQGGAIRVAVSDTGPGIAERHLPRLFERFYRVDTGRSRELGGTGLGLAIVKHLVEAQGGSVGVESVVGKGSTFRMTFPIAAAEEETPASAATA
jgi:two-component system phosphate regulon sensor histidine kinase PhoR